MPTAQVFSSKLLKKTQLTETTFEFLYTCPEDFQFKAGQFVTFVIDPKSPRAYSIVEKTNEGLVFLVDISPGGVASNYFAKVSEGTEIQVKGPFGVYGLKPTDLDKVFICTGTGVAPFVAMVEEYFRSNPEKNTKIKLYFGEKFLKDDYAARYYEKYFDRPNFTYARCITREDDAIISTLIESKKNPRTFKGRVTSIVPEEDIDWTNTEFYLCGANHMVIDMVEKLKSKGASKIYFEKYG